MPALERHDDVFVLDIGDTENRFHPDWLTSVNDLLDEVEKAEGPRALVTADEHGVRQAAAEIAGPQAAKAGPTPGTIKTRMYAPVLDGLRRQDY
jgi:hypothetical protein